MSVHSVLMTAVRMLAALTPPPLIIALAILGIAVMEDHALVRIKWSCDVR